ARPRSRRNPDGGRFLRARCAAREANRNADRLAGRRRGAPLSRPIAYRPASPDAGRSAYRVHNFSSSCMSARPLRAGILAAGRGERLRTQPTDLKPLARVSGETLIERVLNSIVEAGASEV